MINSLRPSGTRCEERAESNDRAERGSPRHLGKVGNPERCRPAILSRLVMLVPLMPLTGVVTRLALRLNQIGGHHESVFQMNKLGSALDTDVAELQPCRYSQRLPSLYRSPNMLLP